MTVSGAVARPLLAGMFIYGGLDAVRDPEGKAKMADDVAPRLAEMLHLPTSDTVTLVRINGGVQMAAGTMLALGKFRRLSAVVLAGSLIPTTYAGHRFWEEMDEDRRAMQRVQFLKNAAMLGGLMLAASDTGGRPSLPWAARRAAKHAVEATVAAGVATQDAARSLLSSPDDVTHDAKQTIASAATAAGAMASHVTQLAKETDWEEIGRQASDVGKRAAKAAKKAQKSDLGRRALKAAKKAEKMAAKAKVSKRAERIANKARKNAIELAKQAEKLAGQAELRQRSAAAANKAAKVSAAAISRARDAVPDDAVDRIRDRANTVAHHAADRVTEGLSRAS